MLVRNSWHQWAHVAHAHSANRMVCALRSRRWNQKHCWHTRSHNIGINCMRFIETFKQHAFCHALGDPARSRCFAAQRQKCTDCSTDVIVTDVIITTAMRSHRRQRAASLRWQGLGCQHSEGWWMRTCCSSEFRVSTKTGGVSDSICCEACRTDISCTCTSDTRSVRACHACSIVELSCPKGLVVPKGLVSCPVSVACETDRIFGRDFSCQRLDPCLLIG